MSGRTSLKRKLPSKVYKIKILEASNRQLLQTSEEMGLALNLEEMQAIRSHFTKKGRNPTDIELQTVGQAWSEHCYHKTFKGTIMMPDGSDIDSLFQTYIENATRELNMP